jgi:pimeloyl-ACP methyl ester carboxylesterase
VTPSARLLLLAGLLGLTAPVVTAQPAIRTDTVRVQSPRGYGVRTIITRPVEGLSARRAAILFIPWLSCDPVEVPGPTDDGYIRFVRDLAAQSGMIVDRVEKPGVDGSEGPPCATATLDDDFAAFRAALRALRARPDVDSSRVYLVGGSIGGTLAVVLAAEAPGTVARIVSVNGFARTWYEHMIDHERRRLSLRGVRGDSLGTAMRGFERLYTEYLIGRRTPGQAITNFPELRTIWYDTTTGQYGRSATYFHQVQVLDVDGALARVNAPVLFIGGEYDWVMGASDAPSAAASVNVSHAGLATARVYPRMSHGLHTFASAADAFRGRNGEYAADVARDVAAWLRKNH